MQSITSLEIGLVQNLSNRTYTDNTIRSNSSAEERAHLKQIKDKLRKMATFFTERYTNNYGPFQTGGNVGNDIFNGRLGTMWSYLQKGGQHKQYSAQISFVINIHDGCLDVGFYFGSASARGIDSERRTLLTNQLNNLGQQLHNSLINITELNNQFQSLFDEGFIAIAANRVLLPNEWINEIDGNPAKARVITKLFPNEFGIIELSKIDFAVSKVISLMAGINEQLTAINRIPRPPKTPEQRALEAARRTEIGTKGELFVLRMEKEKLNKYANRLVNYPIHQSEISDEFGYDILSHDEDGNDVFIEVKTTTRSRLDPMSKEFYISGNEKNFFQDNIDKYQLIRVYEVEGNPSMEEIDMSQVEFSSISYKVSY